MGLNERCHFTPKGLLQASVMHYKQIITNCAIVEIVSAYLTHLALTKLCLIFSIIILRLISELSSSS